MKYKIPTFMYTIKAILFISIILSLCFLNDLTTAVIYLVSVAINCCEYYIVNKYKVGEWNNIIFKAISRMTIILPLIFMSIKRILLVWILIIVVAFEIFMFIYKNFVSVKLKARKISTILYILYNITMYVSVVAFLLIRTTTAVYSLLITTVLAAAFIIYSSIYIDVEDGVGEEQEESVDSVVDNTEISSVGESGFVE